MGTKYGTQTARSKPKLSHPFCCVGRPVFLPEKCQLSSTTIPKQIVYLWLEMRQSLGCVRRIPKPMKDERGSIASIAKTDGSEKGDKVDISLSVIKHRKLL